MPGAGARRRPRRPWKALGGGLTTGLPFCPISIAASTLWSCWSCWSCRQRNPLGKGRRAAGRPAVSVMEPNGSARVSLAGAAGAAGTSAECGPTRLMATLECGTLGALVPIRRTQRSPLWSSLPSSSSSPWTPGQATQRRSAGCLPARRPAPEKHARARSHTHRIVVVASRHDRCFSFRRKIPALPLPPCCCRGTRRSGE